MIQAFGINNYMADSDYIQKVQDAARNKPYSSDWYREKIKEFGQPGRLDLIRDGKRKGSPFGGTLNMFVYGPKHKAKLPYYDTFPLVLPLEQYNDGFLGLNFHYLPIPLRMKLLDRMLDEDMNVNYSRIKKIKLIQPTLKRYLTGFTKSQFRKIEEDELVIATLLPVHNFKKSDAKSVWSDSRKMI